MLAKVKVPNWVATETAAKALTALASGAGLPKPPAKWHGEVATKTVSMLIPESALNELKCHASRYGWSVDDLTVWLLVNLNCTSQEKKSVLAKNSVSALRRAFYEECKEKLLEGKITLAEGGTGLGKSRIAGQLASAVLEERKKRERASIWVVAPTLAVVQHLVEEISKVKKLKEIGCRPVIALGHNHRVDKEKLRTLIDVERQESTGERLKQIDALDEWLEQGCPPLLAHTRKLAKYCGNIAGFMDDAQNLAPDLDLSLVSMARNGDGDAYACEEKRQLNELIEKAELVVSTHAKIGFLAFISQLSQTELPCTHLIVDEAHEFEENVAGVLSASMALSTLRRTLKKAKAPKEDIDRVAYWEKTLASSNAENLSTAPDELIEFLEEKREEWGRRLKKFSRKQGSGYYGQMAEHCLDFLGKIDRKMNRIHIELSPVMRYPSLLVGPHSVSSLLKFLWNNLKGSVLMSGTLVAPGRQKFNGGYGYMQTCLAIPSDRIAVVSPAHPSWNFSVPLYLPSRECASELTPPDNGDRHVDCSSFHTWIDAVSQGVLHVTQSAKGGTLVLVNSFLDLEEIANRLGKVLDNRLIVTGRGRRLTDDKKCFVKSYRAGKRPVWIALGAAWTGLDLRDEQAERGSDDHLLSTLVIVRLPFGVNRTTTQYDRINRMGFWPSLMDCCIRLRQGIGRLIRREGLLGRRIYILDGRLVSPERKDYMKVIDGVLAAYPVRKTFKLPMAGERKPAKA